MPEKIAVLTGASRGLGRSMALHLAAQGVGIAGTYLRNKDAADEVTAEIEKAGSQAVMLPLDAMHTDTFGDFAAALAAALQAAFGRASFDFLINNAGTGLNVPYTETTEQQFDEVVQVQLKAPFFLTQRLLPMMVDGGRILNVSSGLARFTLPGNSACPTTSAPRWRRCCRTGSRGSTAPASRSRAARTSDSAAAACAGVRSNA